MWEEIFTNTYYKKNFRCGGIEIKNPQASAISKQKPVGQPVLEKHVFLPNIFKLTAQDSVRVNIQIILENKVNVLKFKAVELHNETTKPEELLSPFISDALAGQPMITGEVMVLSNQLGEVRDAVVNGGNLSEQNDCLLVTAKNILSTNQVRNNYTCYCIISKFYTRLIYSFYHIQCD